MGKEDYLYIGIDLHKATHTAVVMNCWNEILDTITIENKPSEFTKLAKKINTKAARLGVTPIYGLENAYGYGRSLAVWLIEKGYWVKDINPALAYAQRISAPMVQKNDAHDAMCVAVVLINQLHTLPDAKPEDSYWTMAQLVNRRDSLVVDGIRLKNALHEQLLHSYPSYRKFFSEVDQKSALYFWKTYPSIKYLEGITIDDLFAEFKAIRSNLSKAKVELILDCVHNDGNTTRAYQQERDCITQSIVRDLLHQKDEIKTIEKQLEKMLRQFNMHLTTIPGVDIATASKLIAEIGDIRRFRNADKLARFAGIAPIKFSSAGKGKEQSSRQGNRTLRVPGRSLDGLIRPGFALAKLLNGIFYFMAVSMVCVTKAGKPNNPVFHAYFHRKISEGKTKSQVLVCIMRRLVDIVYGMMKNGMEYHKPVQD